MLYYGIKLGIGHTHAHTRSLTRELSMTVHGFALVNSFNIRVIFSIGHYLIGILYNISRVFIRILHLLPSSECGLCPE